MFWINPGSSIVLEVKPVQNKPWRMLKLVGGIPTPLKSSSQLGWLFQILKNKKCSKPPIRKSSTRVLTMAHKKVTCACLQLPVLWYPGWPYIGWPMGAGAAGAPVPFSPIRADANSMSAGVSCKVDASLWACISLRSSFNSVTCSYGHLPIITTNKTPFIECISSQL